MHRNHSQNPLTSSAGLGAEPGGQGKADLTIGFDYNREALRNVIGLLCVFVAYLVITEILGKVFDWSGLVNSLTQFIPYCGVLALVANWSRQMAMANKQTLLLALCLSCVFFVLLLDVTRQLQGIRNVPIVGEASRIRGTLSSLAIMVAIGSFPAASYFMMEEVFFAKAKLHTQVEKLQEVERALTLQKMVLEAQNDASIDGTLTVDDNRNVISHNRRFLEIWELPPESIRSGSDAMLLPLLLEKVADPEAVLKRIEKLYENKDESDLMQIALKDGRTFERFSAPVRTAAGAPFGRIWVDRDVSVRIKSEMELRRLYEQTRLDAQTKTELLQEINHRVKNNLISILGLIQTQQLYGPNKADRSVAKGALDRLGHQIRGLIEVHQILSGTEWRPVVLSDLAQRVITAVMGMVEPSMKVRLNVTPSPIVVSPRLGNSVGLAMNELAMNTLKHAAPGRTSTSIRVAMETDGEFVRLQYSDDGPGFPPEVLNGQRQGIGLVLLHQLAQGAFRGSISLSNANGALVVLRIKNDESDRT